MVFSTTRAGQESRFTLRINVRDEVRRPPDCFVEPLGPVRIETDEVLIFAVRCPTPATGSLTFALDGPPDHGSAEGPEVTIDPDATRSYFKYSPAAAYTGPVALRVAVSDGRFTSRVAVPLTVDAAVNDPPACELAGADPGSEFSGDTGRNGRVDFALECTDDEDDDLELSIARAPAHGSITGPDGNGVLEYVPAHNYFGLDRAVLRVSDGVNERDFPVDFGVLQDPNGAPSCTITPATTVPAGSPSPLRVSCSDPEGDPLTVSVGEPPAHGVLSAIPAAGGAFTYLPDRGYRGPDGFSLDVDDGLDGTSATFRTTVGPPLPPDTVLLVHPAARSASAAAVILFSGGYEGRAQCSYDGRPWVACRNRWLIPPLPKGRHRIEVRALGYDGAPDPTPARFDWLVVGAAPDTRISSGPPPLTTATAASFRLSGSEPGTTLACRVDGRAPVPCTSPWPLRGLRIGSHVLEVVATDAAGTSDPTPARRRWRILPPAYRPCLALHGSGRTACERLARSLTSCARLRGTRRAACERAARALARCERLRGARSRARCRALARGTSSRGHRGRRGP